MNRNAMRWEFHGLSKDMLGTRWISLAIVVLVVGLGPGCSKGSPTEPSRALPLSGKWAGGPLGVCVGDWSSVVLVLQQDGSALSGELTTRDGRVFSAAGSVAHG